MTYTPGDPCPHCGGERVVEIVYGMPGPDLVERSERGEVVLGGCLINFENPTHRCRDCGADLWGPSQSSPDPPPTPER